MTAYNHSSGDTYGTDRPTSPAHTQDLRQVRPPLHPAR